MDRQTYETYAELLRQELVPAMGCTEPIAIALTAATAKSRMKGKVESVDVRVSGNIIKNVKSVIVPNTGRLKGIKAAVAAGIVAGDADRELQVISDVPREKHAEIKEYMQSLDLDIQPEDVTASDTVTITWELG